MPTFQSTTTVATTPDVAWRTLLRTELWTQWDRSLERVDGHLAEGGRLEIRVVGTSRPFKLRVSGWEPTRRIVLTGGMPLGLFTGTRTYDLESSGPGTCVTVRETYTGPLAGVIGRSIPDLQPAFDDFVAGLRTAAENPAQ